MPAGAIPAFDPPASDAAAGIVEYATNAEVIAGVLTNRAVTPAGFAAGLARQPEWWTYAVGDDTTAITTGTGKGEFYMPFAFTMTSYRLTLKTGGTVQTTIVDINKNGTTTMTTNKLSVDVSEKTSATAATAAALTTTTWASGDICTIDFDQVGTNAAGVQITFYGTRA